MGKFGYDLIKSMKQETGHARGRNCPRLRVTIVEVLDGETTPGNLTSMEFPAPGYGHKCD
jgi:hypothetical protein